MDKVRVRALRGFRGPVGDPPEFRSVAAGEEVLLPLLLAVEMTASNKVERIADPDPGAGTETETQAERPRRGRPPKGE